MSKKKKVAAILAAVIAAVGVGVYNNYVYQDACAHITIRRHEGLKETGRYFGAIVIGMSYNELHPFLQPLKKDMDALCAWNRENTDYLYGLYEKGSDPFQISVECQMNEGKTTFSYDGIITTEEGETKPYHKEITFKREFMTQSEWEHWWRV